MQTLSNRKIKYLRLLAIFVALVIVVVTTFGVSALRNNALRSSMGAVNINTTAKTLPVNETDAANISAFSDFNPLGDGAHKVAENDSLILYVEDNKSGIRVYDKTSQKAWYSNVTDMSVLGNENISEDYKTAMQSFMTFSYIDLTVNNTKLTQTSSKAETHNVTEETVFGGVRLKFDFEDLNIKIYVDVTLDGESLIVSIPEDGIIENQPSDNSDITAEINKKIDESNKLCKKIKDFAGKNGISSSEKMLIEMSADEIMGVLVNISSQSVSGAVDDLNYDTISMSMDNLILMASMYDELNTLQQDLQTNINKLRDLTAKVSDNRCSGIVELAVLPYFGSQTYGTEGYAFYPDGCGAISYFNVSHPILSGTYEQRVYDRDRNDASYVEASDSNTDSGLEYFSPVSIPVYGVKASNSAFVAVITDDAFDAQINYTPCTLKQNLASIYGSFYLRQMSSVVNSSSETISTYDKQQINSIRSIRYWFLNDDKADYSGMAEIYRNYLQETEQLNKTGIMQNDELPMALTFFVGTETGSNSMNKEYVTMSTFNGIKDFVKKLNDRGVNNTLLYLDNWDDGEGMNSIIKGKVSAEAGGKSGLKELSEYMKEKNHPLFLENCLAEAIKSGVNSAQLDIVTVKNKSLLTLNYDDKVLYNPTYIYNRMLTTSKNALEKLGVNGYDMGDTASLLYFDYNKEAVTDRTGTAAIFRQLSADASDIWDYVSGENANSYQYSWLTWNRNVPEEDSGFLYTDETVPFIQMVIHGSMIYTGTPFNEVYNADKQFLKAVEYGYIPNYFLTEESPLELAGQGMDDFYSTQCSVWEQQILSTYETYKNDFAKLWNKTIVSHEKLSENVYSTEYECGTKVIVNYNNEAATVLGITVEALDYTVVNY